MTKESHRNRKLDTAMLPKVSMGNNPIIVST